MGVGAVRTRRGWHWRRLLCDTAVKAHKRRADRGYKPCRTRASLMNTGCACVFSLGLWPLTRPGGGGAEELSGQRALIASFLREESE